MNLPTGLIVNQRKGIEAKTRVVPIRESTGTL